ncbi:hypothetical protein ACOMHN_050737 [Nucella lapillus]
MYFFLLAQDKKSSGLNAEGEKNHDHHPVNVDKVCNSGVYATCPSILVRRFLSRKKEKYDRQNVRIRLSVPEVPGRALTSGCTGHRVMRPLRPMTTFC